MSFSFMAAVNICSDFGAPPPLQKSVKSYVISDHFSVDLFRFPSRQTCLSFVNNNNFLFYVLSSFFSSCLILVNLYPCILREV